MVIEHAERSASRNCINCAAGWAGATRRAICLLLHDDGLNEIAKRRLLLLRDTEDGFVIADADFRLRGGGDVMGTDRPGEPDSASPIRWSTRSCSTWRIRRRVADRKGLAPRIGARASGQELRCACSGVASRYRWWVEYPLAAERVVMGVIQITACACLGSACYKPTSSLEVCLDCGRLRGKCDDSEPAGFRCRADECLRRNENQRKGNSDASGENEMVVTSPAWWRRAPLGVDTGTEPGVRLRRKAGSPGSGSRVVHARFANRLSDATPDQLQRIDKSASSRRREELDLVLSYRGVAGR